MPVLKNIEHAGVILAKMWEYSIQDFSDEELQRVFKGNVVAPNFCIRVAKAVIENGFITSPKDILPLVNLGKQDFYIDEKTLLETVYSESIPVTT